MSTLVRRLKDYYLKNLHYQYSSFSFCTQIIDETWLRKEIERSINKGTDIFSQIKPMPGPATLHQVEVAEQQLGFAIPPLLRELYLEVGNGGFGPGVFGLDETGWRDGCGYDYYIVNKYLQIKECWSFDNNLDDLIEWENTLKGMLPIASGGCTLYYLLDCREENGVIWQCDDAYLQHQIAPSLAVWLERWLLTPRERLDEFDIEDLPF